MKWVFQSTHLLGNRIRVGLRGGIVIVAQYCKPLEEGKYVHKEKGIFNPNKENMGGMEDFLSSPSREGSKINMQSRYPL
jgi:hypothetical protein